MIAGTSLEPVPIAGPKIAFLSTRDGTADIYVMDADGSNPTRLTYSNPALPPGVGMPAFSPDGTKIVFARITQTENNAYDLYVMNSDGSNQILLTNSAGDDYQPVWSPDGTKIAFSSRRDGNYEIYVVNANGSNPTNLTTNPANDYNPAWSPDGSKIAFDRELDLHGNNEIFVMNADGSDAVQLTSIHYNVDPAWSPDGKRIAFSTWRYGDSRSEIVIMNADGTNQTRLTHSSQDGGAYNPSWSPDGTKVAFAGDSDNGALGICVIDNDGSNLVRLTNYFAVTPSWQGMADSPLPIPGPRDRRPNRFSGTK
jgi:tol-pal system beta propeller repeat protein TolB